MDQVERVLAGDRLALARLISQIENEDPQGLDALSHLYSRTGRAHLIGITGASGTGKSTLVNRLVQHLRTSSASGREPPTVAIVAVDPSSPFSGGAILGDRIRMRDLAGDPGVFIRSMASRGALGGLARGTLGVVDALDAAGFEVILVETVGAGQTEVDIARLAHTTVVVDAPGMGDDVQAIKAGILEIADILVVNKSDLPGADRTVTLLRTTLEAFRSPMGSETGRWEVPVLATSAVRDEGVAELAACLESHRQFLSTSKELPRRQRERARLEMEALLRERLAARWLAEQPDGWFEGAVERVAARQMSPRQAVTALIEGGRL